jgi:hypothetical protein
MAQFAGTTSTYDSNRLREQFSNAIWMISPEETPFQSLVDREDIEGKHPEWQTDTLATPVSSNQVLEGDEYAYTQVAATTRVGNYTEICRKTYIFAGSNEENTKAGPKSELGRERRKKGTEMKTDMELALLANKASVVGDDTTNPRQSAGFAAWIVTNDSRGATGTDGGFAAGLVTAAGNGTQRAFTRALLDTVILNTYTSGGNPTVFMCSPYVKTVFSSFMQGANTAVVNAYIRGESQATIYAAADTYRSDFGVIDIVPNRQLARGGAAHARNGFLIDRSKVAIGIFRDVFEDRPAKTGDAEKRALLCEYSLIMKTQAAHAVVADLFGISAAA